jgi:hypothetical protein
LANAFSKLGHECDAGNQEQASDDWCCAQWVSLHSEPAEMVNEQRCDERGRDRESHKKARPDPVDQGETGIDLHSANQAANDSPPGHRSQFLFALARDWDESTMHLRRRK